MWSQKNLPARRTASCGCADSSGAVGDSAWEVGILESGRPPKWTLCNAEVFTDGTAADS
jgi:hypothetical protein